MALIVIRLIPNFVACLRFMKRIITILLFSVPILVFSQFGVSEFYVTGNLGVGMGMNSYTYQTIEEGASQDHPKFVQLDLGSGFAPELGLGLKLTRDVYVETSVSYIINQDFYFAKSGKKTIEQGFSFNRFTIQLNGKYYVEVNKSFLLDFLGGISYSIPEELHVKVGAADEFIQYAGSVGFQGGFGGNYVVDVVTFRAGIRYRLERFTIKPKQKLPMDFDKINPNFQNISSSGIDLVFGIQYNF